MKKEYQNWVEYTLALLPLDRAIEKINKMPYERYVKAMPRLEELQKKAMEAIETFEGATLYTTEYEMVVRNGYLTDEEFEELKELEFLIC